MDLGLYGKKALITGATLGIGYSIAEHFAQEGCNIAICARNKDQVNNTIRQLSEYGVKVMGAVADVAQFNEFKKWISEVCSNLGGLDIYISNVSAQSRDWITSFNTDILGCINGIESAIPFLKKSDNASIIAIASQSALLSNPTYKAYPAMKAALIHYISSLSREMASYKIRANSVSPSEVYFDGGIWERIRNETPEKYERALKKNVLGRFATPEDVAKAVVFIASPAASFISGTNLLIDGASKEFVHY